MYSIGHCDPPSTSPLIMALVFLRLPAYTTSHFSPDQMVVNRATARCDAFLSPPRVTCINQVFWNPVPVFVWFKESFICSGNAAVGLCIYTKTKARCMVARQVPADLATATKHVSDPASAFLASMSLSQSRLGDTPGKTVHLFPLGPEP